MNVQMTGAEVGRPALLTLGSAEVHRSKCAPQPSSKQCRRASSTEAKYVHPHLAAQKFGGHGLIEGCHHPCFLGVALMF